jgi:hypothetical protein
MTDESDVEALFLRRKLLTFTVPGRSRPIDGF